MGLGSRFETLGSIRVRLPGAFSRRRSKLPPALPGKELPYSTLDVVADLTDALQGLSLRIRERPVLPAKPRNDRALLAAAHGDQEVGVSRQILGEPLRCCRNEVDSSLAHHLDDL